MGYRSELYNLLLTLHILAAIIGFGGVFLNGIHGSRAKAAGGAAGLAIGESVDAVAKVANYLIYAVFVTGVLLVLVSDDAIGWEEPWLSASMLLYIIGIGLSHGLLRPAAAKMRTLQRELASGAGPAAAGGPPPQAAELEQLGRRVALVSTVLNVLLVAILLFMVYKPGATGSLGTA